MLCYVKKQSSERDNTRSHMTKCINAGSSKAFFISVPTLAMTPKILFPEKQRKNQNLTPSIDIPVQRYELIVGDRGFKIM